MSEFFYNTISLKGENLQVATAKALAQANLILEIFKANPEKLISPSQILYIVKRKYGLHWPVTSCRRAITDLTKDKYNKALTKTSVMVTGDYGQPEHQWMLTAGNEEKLEKLKYEKGVTTAADFASMIINSGKPKFNQTELFTD